MGRALASALEQTGRDVVQPSRSDFSFSEPTSMRTLLETSKADAIINLAAISSVVHGETSEIYQTNAFGHFNLLDAAKAFGFSGPILLASSANIYGQNPKEKFSESDLPAPVNHYGVSKTMAEHYNRFFQYDLDVSAARPFNCIGLGQSEAFVVGKIVSAFACKAKTLELGNLEVRRDYIDIRDIAQMWIALLEAKQRPKIVNFGSGKAVSLREIIDKCKSISGHSPALNVLESLKRPSDILYQCADTSLINRLRPQAIMSLDQTLNWMLERGSKEKLE